MIVLRLAILFHFLRLSAADICASRVLLVILVIGSRNSLLPVRRQTIPLLEPVDVGLLSIWLLQTNFIEIHTQKKLAIFSDLDVLMTISDWIRFSWLTITSLTEEDATVLPVKYKIWLRVCNPNGRYWDKCAVIQSTHRNFFEGRVPGDIIYGCLPSDVLQRCEWIETGSITRGHCEVRHALTNSTVVKFRLHPGLLC